MITKSGYSTHETALFKRKDFLLKYFHHGILCQPLIPIPHEYICYIQKIAFNKDLQVNQI